MSPVALLPFERTTIGGLSVNLVHGEAAEMFGLQIGAGMNLERAC